MKFETVKKAASFFIKCLPLPGTAILFFLVFRSVDTKSTFEALRGISPGYLAAAMAISFASNIVLGARKWMQCLTVVGYRLTLAQAVFMKLGFFPLATIFPFKTGEIPRLEYLKRRHGVPFTLGTASIVYDNMVNIFAFGVIMGFVSPLFAARHKWFFFMAIPLMLLFRPVRRLIVTWFRLIPGDLHLSIVKAFSLFDKVNTRTLLSLLIQAVVYKLSSPVLSSFLLMKGLGVSNISFGEICGPVMLIDLALALPVTVGGLGAREAAYVMLFSAYGIASRFLGVGIAASFVERLFPAIIGLPLTYFYLRHVVGRMKDIENGGIEQTAGPV
jgi:hypothetical protein